MPDSSPAKDAPDNPASNSTTNPAASPAANTTVNLDEARLQIGDSVQIQPLGEPNGARHYVRLIGFAKNSSVLLSTPKVDGSYIFVRDGQNYVVRAFSGKNAYAFSTTVIRSVAVPYPYLHLSYPKDVRALVVRRGARAKVNLIASSRRLDAQGQEVAEAVAASIRNVSISGALIVSPHPLGLQNDTLRLSFKLSLNDIVTLVTLDGVIRAVNPSGEEIGPGMIAYGLEFVGGNPQDRITLTAFVYQKLLEQEAA